jgi:hypothetical protein
MLVKYSPENKSYTENTEKTERDTDCLIRKSFDRKAALKGTKTQQER